MRILTFESSAKQASVAVWEDQVELGFYFVNTKQTHSQTLMPMAAHLLAHVGLSSDDIDYCAVGAGPGSFTGVRIAISCAKGFAFTHKTPCVPISTLEAIAYGCAAYEGRDICAVMDARRDQVYMARFQIQNGVPVRFSADQALPISDLINLCDSAETPLIFAGDGALLCYEKLQPFGAQLADKSALLQTANGVARAAFQFANERSIPHENLTPLYLRLPQAERERLKKDPLCGK